MAIPITMSAGTLPTGVVYNSQTFLNAICARMNAVASGTPVTIVPGTLPAGAAYNAQSFLVAAAARMTVTFPGRTSPAIPMTVVLTGTLLPTAVYSSPQAYYNAIVPLMNATIPAIPP